MAHIVLEDVNLCYKMRREWKLKDILVPGSHRFNDLGRDGIVHALKDIKLQIRDGERVSIIGHNGAGKSSFLKLVAGIYPPASGRMDVKGRISSLFELATGFEMESSGWENIYLRGLMLGETPKSIRAKMNEIAEFSELGDFLNAPVKYYSSGMFVRLAFSVSTAIEPDILLLDEVIAAGDASFLLKARNRMKELMNTARILVLVTHNMHDAVELTERCLWLDRGRILMDGTPAEITKAYLESTKTGGVC